MVCSNSILLPGRTAVPVPEMPIVPRHHQVQCLSGTRIGKDLYRNGRGQYTRIPDHRPVRQDTPGRHG